MNRLTITEIQTWNCVLPLAQPVNLGNFVIRERTHLALRVRTDQGLIADCVTQARGLPLDVIVSEVLAPRLVGKDALDIHARHAELLCELTAVGMDGAVGRAWSALEICLQDLRAQAAGWPLWRLLGGAPRAVDVELVEGYALPDESDEQFAERLAARAAEGYKYLKIEAGHYARSDDLIRRLRAFRRLVPGATQLVLDFAWSWSNAKDKIALTRDLEEFGVAWIEDPFARHQIDEFAALQQGASLPVGAGDEATRAGDMRLLIDARALDLVRLDATTIGGLEAVRELNSRAQSRGLRVSFHEHAEVHEHCVFGLGASDHVEIFPTDRPFDRVHDIIEASTFQRVRKGRLLPADAVGTGLRLKDDAVAGFANRHARVTA